MKQIKPFKPGFTLGERAEKLEKKDNLFIVTTCKEPNMKHLLL